MPNPTSLFVFSLVGLTVSASVLIVLIPTFFGSGDPAALLVMALLAILVAACGAGARHWRPTTSSPDHD